MDELAVAREIAAPGAPNSRHFDAPRWWPEWIAQVLATAASVAPAARAPAPASVAPPAGADAARVAALALRDALQSLREAEGVAPDPFELAVARHQVFLARRAWQASVEQAAGPGAHWCLCALEAAPPR